MVNSSCNSIYNPRKYSGMIWKHRHIKSTCFVFHTGRIMCMGNTSLKGSKKDLRKYARLVNKQGYSVSLGCITVVTKSAVATLSGKLNIDEASVVLKGRYDPEIFMAVMFRQGCTNFTCFHSGKVVMTGVKKLKYLVQMLMDLEMFTL